MFYMLLLKEERSAHPAGKTSAYAATSLTYQLRMVSGKTTTSRDKRHYAR